jgi:hypothetical protein
MVHRIGTFDDSAQSPNKRLILSPLCVLRMLSAMVGLMSNVTSFAQPLACWVCGIVFVTCEVISEIIDAHLC